MKYLTVFILFSFSTLLSAQNSFENHFKLANASFQMKQYNEAILLYSKAIEVEPNDWRAYYQRGLSYHYLKKYSEALDDYETSLKLVNNPSKKEYIHFNKGLVNYTIKMDIKSLIDFNRVIKINDKNAEAWFMAGMACVDLNRKEQAVKNFKKAIELEPENKKYSSALQKMKSNTFDDFIATGIGMIILASAIDNKSEKNNNSESNGEVCQYCNSLGYKTCWSCNGVGGKFVLSNYSVCNICSGRKTLDCTYCDN